MIWGHPYFRRPPYLTANIWCTIPLNSHWPWESITLREISALEAVWLAESIWRWRNCPKNVVVSSCFCGALKYPLQTVGWIHGISMDNPPRYRPARRPAEWRRRGSAIWSTAFFFGHVLRNHGIFKATLSDRCILNTCLQFQVFSGSFRRGFGCWPRSFRVESGENGMNGKKFARKAGPELPSDDELWIVFFQPRRRICDVLCP